MPVFAAETYLERFLGHSGDICGENDGEIDGLLSWMDLDLDGCAPQNFQLTLIFN